MTRQFLILLLALFSFTFTSCSDEEIIDDTVFIFGSTYGFCVGNCTHLFLYDGTTAYRDNMERYVEPPTFSDISEADIASSAQLLLDEFPDLLKESSDERYGCPDCADQGTLFLRLQEGDGIRTWYLDTRVQEDWPKELAAYVVLLGQELGKIIE